MGSIDSVAQLATSLIRRGRVVPSLTVDENGQARSQWLPLPSGADRGDLLTLLDDLGPQSQEKLATLLAKETDTAVRHQLVSAGVLAANLDLDQYPAHYRDWFESLHRLDPRLSNNLDTSLLVQLADDVDSWIASVVAVPSSVKLVLQIHEPPLAAVDHETIESDALLAPSGPWRIEPLVQDATDSSLLLPLASLFDHDSPFSGEALEDGLRALARAARLAPELKPMLDQALPSAIDIETDQLIGFIRTRSVVLATSGVKLYLPKWWTARPRLGLRARTSTQSTDSPPSPDGVDAPDPADDTTFGLGRIIDFSWEAALGEATLSAADLAQLEQAVAAKQHLIQLRGQWVILDPSQLDAVLDRVGQQLAATAGDVIRAGLGLGDLDGVTDAGVKLVGVEGDGWIGDVLTSAVHGQVQAVPTPTGFNGQLRPYQERGVGWLRFLGRIGLGACLADDMGLGKTAQLIGSLLDFSTTPTLSLVDRHLSQPALVICPVSVLGNWRLEVERFAPTLSVQTHHGPDRPRDLASFQTSLENTDVIISTYSLLSRDADLFQSINWGWVVLDEAQQIKNPTTQAAQAARALKADRRIALTGTPVENRLAELWSIMEFCNPGLLGSKESFRMRFSRPIEADGDTEAIQLLKKVTSPFVLRRLKSDRSIIKDLPDKIETIDRCVLSTEQVSLYQAIVDDLIESSKATDGIERKGLVLAGITRLKQICNHPAHYLDDGTNLVDRSGKLTRIEELLDEILASGEKVLCFTQFRAWGDRLAPYIAKKFGVETTWLHGGVSQPDRQAMVERFGDEDGPPVMLLSLKAGGSGLNLVSASHVIHLDRWWNPAVEDQATDRAYRIGQTKNVHVHKLVCSGTVEERIHDMIQAKRVLSATVIGTGERWITELDTEELTDLVKLSTGAESSNGTGQR